LGLVAGHAGLLAWALPDDERDQLIECNARLAKLPWWCVEDISGSRARGACSGFYDLPGFVIRNDGQMGIDRCETSGMVVAALSVAASWTPIVTAPATRTGYSALKRLASVWKPADWTTGRRYSA